MLKPYAEEREGVNLCDCNSNASVSACVCEWANRVGETETKHTVFFEGALEVNLVLSRSLSLSLSHMPTRTHTLTNTRFFSSHAHHFFQNHFLRWCLQLHLNHRTRKSVADPWCKKNCESKVFLWIEKFERAKDFFSTVFQRKICWKIFFLPRIKEGLKVLIIFGFVVVLSGWTLDKIWVKKAGCWQSLTLKTSWSVLWLEDLTFCFFSGRCQRDHRQRRHEGKFRPNLRRRRRRQRLLLLAKGKKDNISYLTLCCGFSSHLMLCYLIISHLTLDLSRVSRLAFSCLVTKTSLIMTLAYTCTEDFANTLFVTSARTPR